ncbi:hypothetical protein DB35_04955 [Streptomyces abyssalis]|uniref:Uncharacterized protein n=2 Tax=Streptomyces TaxID=1883 RepID=A0A1E7JQL5_9ACTN|nr:MULTISPECIES: hypothetical protein [Streptomyces]OEU90534.1 hypothetical protein AN215_14030 [Streptomyces abyssalis]OEU95273.1 hypothetical protein DB35_04955 [Streptomyces abyssalis]QPP07284.1 hypothetical protein G4Z16_13815 [Streptomyces bathyalis]
MSTPTRSELARSNTYLRRQLAALRHDHTELLGASRAAVVAHYDGHALPLSVLIDTLDQLGQLPEYEPQLAEELLTGPLPLAGRRIA